MRVHNGPKVTNGLLPVLGEAGTGKVDASNKYRNHPESISGRRRNTDPAREGRNLPRGFSQSILLPPRFRVHECGKDYIVSLRKR